ncbi:hypothetical protein PIB30_030192 [Stylosanthes scabra]|uniref:BUD13 homolog n=1 Tax=Stylosanthes scabra TaxID=79078 RepID=A0ABU6TDD7_9FABA|nr:hypothetical protein [Stylosanthes scabra]
MKSNSLKDYLKRYQSNPEEEKKSKKKKKQKQKSQPQPSGLLVVDEDPSWQKPVDLGEENDEKSSDEEKPLVDEDIEVKRMKRLEQLRARRPYHAISEDGSGWVSLSSQPADPINVNDDMSPPRKRRVRNDTPSPEHETNLETSDRKAVDLSPSNQQLKRNDTPSPEHDSRPVHSKGLDNDLSPPRKRRVQSAAISPACQPRSSDPNLEDADLSPPRQRHRGHHNLSPDISPPRRSQRQIYDDKNKNYNTSDLQDLSPPRRRHRHDSPVKGTLHGSEESDLSPPRKRQKDIAIGSLSPDLSPPRKSQKGFSNAASVSERKTGLISGKDIREEIDKKKKDDLMRFKMMDPSISGRGAEPVYRDKVKGVRISKEEYLKSKQKVVEKPKEKEIEWGKGLAQKREAEAKLKELEVEKDKPFARTRDDPELDNMLKDRLRWGDPMAHLVKKKYPEPVLPDLGEGEKMKESGFVVPQDIPNHSWLKRGLEAAPNRYGIRPGRHWDGVDRSNGFEKEMFKRANERQARDREAYLWSVSDM